eukprot:GHVL01009725.1.p1 GENE.GHVL01009725.1~~GHVL01009725.1.p1  ORF type:complete len:433 (-),score=66.08 GHVL01009725.1:328-1626(-)
MFYYDLRSMFLPGLPGLRKRVFAAEQLLLRFVPDLVHHMIEIGAVPQLVLCDWLLTLFSYSMPLEPLALLWDDFLRDGWVCIYRLIVQRMVVLKDTLMDLNDIADFMYAAKFGGNAKGGLMGMVSNLWIQRTPTHTQSYPGRNTDRGRQPTRWWEGWIPTNTASFSNDPNCFPGDSWTKMIQECRVLDISQFETAEYERKFMSSMNIERPQEILVPSEQPPPPCSLSSAVLAQSLKKLKPPPPPPSIETSGINEKTDSLFSPKSKEENGINSVRAHGDSNISPLSSAGLTLEYPSLIDADIEVVKGDNYNAVCSTDAQDQISKASPKTNCQAGSSESGTTKWPRMQTVGDGIPAIIRFQVSMTSKRNHGEIPSFDCSHIDLKKGFKQINENMRNSRLVVWCDEHRKYTLRRVAHNTSILSESHRKSNNLSNY